MTIGRSAAVLTAVLLGFGGAPAHADPVSAPGVTLPVLRSDDGSYIEDVLVEDAHNIRLSVYSAAMHRSFAVDVERPENTSVPQPALYLLNGAGGGVDDASWQLRTDALDFLADKNINVVQIIGGAFTFYTDWLQPDPAMGGVNKWATYLSKELPPLIDAALGTNGVNAIAGLSMSGIPVLDAVIGNPGMYRSAAVYSGLTQTSDPLGREAVKLTVRNWGGGTVTNMWGADDNPLWVTNDPTVQAEKLRGTHLFISTGNGIPGVYDAPGGKFRLERPEDNARTVAVGAFIEANIDLSTRTLQHRLNDLNIPATFVYRNSGTHSWGYWQDDLKASWPVLAQGLYSAP
ncbi:alpha/beta hydrolase [Nocardia sp. NPDC020380]|uniref:alpha/beta hydrolase n=1 Tax=Nocardia sp. NPDC020380 TaxID=3364309 RepID=UPI0037B60F62